MARAVTLFTGQWADLPFEQMCKKAKSFGYEGLELASWGDHFEVDKALADKLYVKKKWEILSASGLKAFAVSAHLVGQAVCDLIDERHKSILPAEVWGRWRSRRRAAAGGAADDRHRKGNPVVHRCRSGTHRVPGRR